jgi:hypothetical protein
MRVHTGDGKTVGELAEMIRLPNKATRLKSDRPAVGLFAGEKEIDKGA